MESFKVRDVVTVREKSLHGNHTVLKTGEVVAVTGDRVKVAIRDQFGSKEFQASQLEHAKHNFGVEPNMANAREMPIKKMFREIN